MNNKINAGIIGLGVGLDYLKTLQDYSQVESVYICDNDKTKLDNVNNFSKLKGKYTNYVDLLRNKEINTIFICSYDQDHTRMAIEALDYCSNVMIEKPICNDINQFRELVSKYDPTLHNLQSNLVLRTNPLFREIKKRIMNNELGDIWMGSTSYIHNVEDKVVNGWRSKSNFYSPILGAGIHVIDLILWLTQKKVDTVYSIGNKNTNFNSKHQYDLRNIITLRMEDGSIFNVEINLGPTYPQIHEIRLFGEKLTLEKRYDTTRLFERSDITDYGIINKRYDPEDRGAMVKIFCDGILTGIPQKPDFTEILYSHKVALAAVQSQKELQPIKLETFLR